MKIAKQTIFVASDGARFDTERDAEKHEKILAAVAKIMKRMKPRPNDDGCHFSNGRGFLQHDATDVLYVQRQLVKLAKLPKDFQDHINHAMAAVVPVGQCFIARLMDECAPAPVSMAFRRIGCIDNQFREWGQPYYATHPEAAQQIAL